MNLQDIRKKIDHIDTQVLALLNERTGLAKEVGQIKKASGQAVFAPEREELLLNQLEKKNKGPISHSTLRAIYREILSASRSMQKQLRVSYLGPEASYCHQAALDRFGTSDQYLPARSIPEIFAMVQRDEADACVVPIENSIEGGVNATHDSLVSTDLSICGEIYLHVRHMLMASPDSKEIKKIYSHPQSFGQCRQWLMKHYPAADLIEVSSNSAGALRVLEDPHAAAIASQFAARHYELKVLDHNIQDVARNLTRFLILSRSSPVKSKNDKTSLLFTVSHEVGALTQVLEIFSLNKLNLEKIESRPAAQKEWEYLFFVDVKGHSQQANLKRALAQIRRKTLWLKILGSYPQANKNV
ncbi:MAG: prephenate dehydratase [Blastochloris sp.]|jgi:chorismate mutase/prephenate dehydratase|nr:prephenate dehydratase [Blastochloris sp.]